jgi:hypothetical protein
VITAGQRIKELQEGQSLVLEKLDFGGSLEVRKLRSGAVLFYWRYTQDGRTERVPIGPYDSAAPPKSLEPTIRGFSVKAALRNAGQLAERNANTPGGLRAAEHAKKAAESAAAAAADALRKHTLEALCAAYVEHLKTAKKVSWSDVQNIFKNHLLQPYPELAAKPANQVEKRETVIVVRRLTEAGKKTTARKLRSYLRAAYACAVRADSDPTLPSAFISFNVQSNPVEGTTAIRGKADKRPLTATQLCSYWRALKQEEGVIGAALRLHLLAGAQRTQQLNRVTDKDVGGGVLRLYDLKGNRVEPREHLIPISRLIQRELDLLPEKGYILSTDGGNTRMHSTSLSTWANEVAKRAKIAEFQLKRVRSGVETLLAACGVPKDVRGQLQSHGIGGVQDTHYDAHEYLQEKRRALDLLHKALTSAEKGRAGVTPTW